MNRKHNSLLSLAALLLLAVILVLICAGCADEDQLEMYKKSDRFTVEWYANNDRTMPDCYIITDTETGAQYLYVSSHNSAGLTQLLPGEAPHG